MITVISSPNCNKCRIAKRRLELAKVPFKAEMMNSFPTEDQMFYVAMAHEHGQMEFPIIMNEDNEILDLEGVLTDARQNKRISE